MNGIISYVGTDGEVAIVSFYFATHAYTGHTHGNSKRLDTSSVVQRKLAAFSSRTWVFKLIQERSYLYYSELH